MIMINKVSVLVVVIWVMMVVFLLKVVLRYMQTPYRIKKVFNTTACSYEGTAYTHTHRDDLGISQCS